MEDWENGGFGVYVHWPFCASKCPYCDFNSHVASTIDEARWRAAYAAEIARVGRLTGRRRVESIFFGGGTPSLMDPGLVAAVLEAVREAWDVAPGAEITLEANPGSVEAGRFRAYAEAGINRVSLGVQALNDTDLRRLGRQHSAAEARAAFDIARGAFSRVSFDLIYARQHQTIDGWRAELAEAAAMAVDHLSLYQLTIEEGTVFSARAAAGHLRGLPGDDLAADMYLITNDFLDRCGYPAYEVSNHAAAGAACRHNLVYWRGGDYAGIGPGAHGRLTLGGRCTATEAVRNPDAWLGQVEAAGCGELPPVEIPPEERAREYLMMSLRLAEGTDIARHAALAGEALSGERIADLCGMGLVTLSGDRLAATVEGRLVLNAVIRDLLPDQGGRRRSAGPGDGQRTELSVWQS